MIDRTEAEQSARRLLDDIDYDEELVLVDALTREGSTAWLFVYNSRRFVETGDHRYAFVGAGPILVDRTTGEAAFAPHNVAPDEVLRRHAAGEPLAQ